MQLRIAPFHRSSISDCGMITLCIILLLGGGAARGAAGELRLPFSRAAHATLSASGPIPQNHYKSWSLFLISSPEWLLNQSDDSLRSLYDQFLVFGNAIGDENLAVWFWSHETGGSEDRKDNVDVSRSVAVCKRLNLKPSEGPYVVVITEYPGECMLTDPDSFPKQVTHALVIKLNGNNAAPTTHLLGVLANKLLTEDLSKLQSNPKDYWNGWRNVFTKVSTVVVDLSSKVIVVFNTGPLKTEMNLGR